MRACVIAAALIVFTQPAFAASSHRSGSHRAHVSHLAHHHHHHASRHHRAYVRLRRVPLAFGYGMAEPFAPPSGFAETGFGNPFVAGRPWQQQTWAAPGAAQPVPFGAPSPRMRGGRPHDAALDAMIARHAAANGLPIELVHRVVTRESGYNPHARSGGNLGLMQIKYATARSVGYNGPPSGLMDPETNLTYAVRYLAGAYRAAGGNANRAVALYASGYHRRGMPRGMDAAAGMPWQAASMPGRWW